MNDASDQKDKIQELFRAEKLVVVNVGSRIFNDAIAKQGCKVVQVNWKPVAGGDRELQEILAVLGGF